MARRRPDDLSFDEFGDIDGRFQDDFAEDGRFLPSRNPRGGGGSRSNFIPIRKPSLGENPIPPLGGTNGDIKPTKDLIASIGTLTTKYYDLKIERKVDGKWVESPSDNLSKRGNRTLSDLSAIQTKLISFNLGFKDIVQVNQGKYFEVIVKNTSNSNSAKIKAKKLAGDLLVNDIIEDYKIIKIVKI